MAIININRLLELLKIEPDDYKEDSTKMCRAIRCPCPIHHGIDYNFWIDLDNEGYQCHSICHRGGKITDLVAEINNIEIKEARALMNNLSIVINKPHQKRPPEDYSIPFPACTIPPPPGIILTNQYKGIDPKFLSQFNIYLSTGEDWKGWYIFPIHNEIGEYVGFQCRRSSDYIEPKYQFMSGLKKSKIIYNYHRVKTYKTLYIFEGIKSVVLAYQHGLYNTASILGSDMSRKQAYLLKNHHLIVCLDNDAAGRVGINRLTKYNLQIDKIITLPPDIEFDELSQEEHNKYLYDPWSNNQ